MKSLKNFPRINTVPSYELRKAIDFYVQNCGVHAVGKDFDLECAFLQWIPRLVGPIPPETRCMVRKVEDSKICGCDNISVKLFLDDAPIEETVHFTIIPSRGNIYNHNEKS